MTLPVLVIASVAWWKIHSPSTQVADSPPEDLSQGPLRLVLSPWVQQQPSPADVATGHTLKWATRFWIAGAAKGKSKFLIMSTLTRDLNLHYRQGSHWRTVQYPGGWNGLRFWTDNADSNGRIDLAVPINLTPANADEVRLRGTLQSRIIERIGRFDYTHDIKSEPVDILVRRKGDPPPNPQINRQSPLEVDKTTIKLLGDAANEGRANAQIEVRFRWNYPLWQRGKPTGFRTQQVQLVDERGHDWLKHAPADGAFALDRKAGSLSEFHEDVSGFYESGPYWKSEVQTSYVPKSAGQLRLRALVAPEWDGGYADWPVQTEAVVRPRWLTCNPRDLKVQKVSIASQNLRVGSSHSIPVISIELKYTSPKPLFARGESGVNGCINPSCWDNDPAISQIPFGAFESGVPAREGKPRENELIVSWSQRLQDKLAPSVVLNSRNDITVLEPKINGDQITAKYELKAAMNTLRPQTFLADIGLRGQGMIPIRVELTPGANGQPQIAR